MADALRKSFILGPGQLSFAYLFKAKDTDQGPKYMTDLIFPADWYDSDQHEDFKEAMYACYESKFGPDEKKWPRGVNDRGPDKVIRDGEDRADKWDGYKKGRPYIKASTKEPVPILDQDRNEVLNSREVYGGRWARIKVTMVPYDNKSKGLGVYLDSVQLLDHDEPFGGGRGGDPRDDFDDWKGSKLGRESNERDVGSRGHARDDLRQRPGGGDDRTGRPVRGARQEPEGRGSPRSGGAGARGGDGGHLRDGGESPRGARANEERDNRGGARHDSPREGPRERSGRVVREEVDGDWN